MRTTVGVLQLDLPIGLFDSGTRELLARHEWYIYVRLTVLPRLTSSLDSATSSNGSIMILCC